MQFEVDWLRDLIAIEQVLLRMFRSIDTRDYESAVNAFAEDGIWCRMGGERQGRAAIRQELDQRPPRRRIEHIVSNLIVDVLSDRGAKANFKTLAFADAAPVVGQPSPLTHPIALDAYEAELALENGAWRVARLWSVRMFEVMSAV